MTIRAVRPMKARTIARAHSRHRARRGFAMMTALWLVVAIAAVAVQFSYDAHERYTLGIAAAERGIARAAANGALAAAQAKLELALRNAALNGSTRLRSSDPWLGADTLYSGVIDIDSVSVNIEAKTGGTQLNVNTMSEDQLRAFFSFLLNDASTADELAQSIMDWRDTDDQARTRGGERDQYLKDHKLVLPANAPFREVDDMLDVNGMTPEILAKARPYLRTYGGGPLNLNAADEHALRALTGMTDAIMTRILAARSNGRRITSIDDVIPGGAPRPGQRATAQQNMGQTVGQQTTVDTNEIDLVITARANPQAQPARLSAFVLKSGQTASVISFRQW